MSARRTSAHTVADIRFTDEESSLICSCGWDDHTPDQDALPDRYQNHRVASGERRRTVSEGIGEGSNEFSLSQKSGILSIKKGVAA